MAEWTKVGIVKRRKSVTLDGSGNGQLDFDVITGNQRWIITDVVVNTSQARTQTPYPNVITYLGGVQLGMSAGATWDGNQDTFHGKFIMGACDTFSVQFQGGKAGTIATAILEGDNEQWK